jgi:hypothetical protein
MTDKLISFHNEILKRDLNQYFSQLLIQSMMQENEVFKPGDAISIITLKGAIN